MANRKPVMVYLDESFKKKVRAKLDALPYPTTLSALVRKLLAQWVEHA